MSKRTVYAITYHMDGMDILARVQYDSEYKEYIAQVSVPKGEWSNPYYTDDKSDAIGTLNHLAKGKAAQQKIARIASINH